MSIDHSSYNDQLDMYSEPQEGWLNIALAVNISILNGSLDQHI